jgi:Tol biopolymer transport system component
MGIYRIEAETGATSLIVESEKFLYGEWAPDGKAIYYNLRGFILKRDLATGTEKEAVRLPTGAAFAFSLSPDGQSIALVSDEGSTANIVVIPLETGAARNVLRVSAPEQIRRGAALSWTPDGRGIIAMKSSAADSRVEVWEVPIDGRPPRSLNIDPNSWSGEPWRLSPDGKRMAFVGTAGKAAGTEIWALENLAPTPKTK